MNYSKQRNLIYDIVSKTDTHPTAEDVYLEAKKVQSNISLSTVYRNLELLNTSGKILRIKVANSSDRFDGDIRNHYHIKCIKCNNIIDVDTSYMESIDKKMQDISGATILSHDLIFYGICDKCKE